ncbi:MAG: hypothetical protein JST16_10645 [Bdellovibrionales bacterium]|nr:hypothetical protein [Bdellovibrionales bacterium]
MATLLGILLQANTDASIAVFSVLRTAPVKRDAIIAAADATLPERDVELWMAISGVLKVAESHRNDIVHGQWGESSHVPDGLLWMEAKHHNTWHANVLVSEQRSTKRPSHEDLARHFFIYRKSDLEEVLAEIEQAWWLMFEFVGYVRITEPVKREAKYHQQCDQPLVRAELDRLRRRGAQTP